MKMLQEELQAIFIMFKFTFLSITFLVISFCSNAQSTEDENNSSSATVVGSEYVPLEGRSKTPNLLEGKWVLQSASTSVKKAKSEILVDKQPEPVVETKRDSVVTTKTVNGVTYTSTEIEIERVGKPTKQITPQQKDKMHKPEKPNISFYGANETFSGFTGCNKFAGRYSLKGNKITFLRTAPTTKMICLGEYDEDSFLSSLKQVTSIRANNGKLELLNGGEVLFVFNRK